MKHIGCFSGGKDSTTLMLWMREHIGVPGRDWTPVICDTRWEHSLTYAYAEEINQVVLNGSLVWLKSEKYPAGFVQLATERNRIPSVRGRFCTEELKIFPLHKYYESLDDEVTSYQGIRADESASRANMTEQQWVDDAGGYWIRRPLLRWSVEQVFEMHRKYGIKPNPLYLMGSSRVGCWPCIMTGLGELKRILKSSPELKQRLIDLEAHVNANASNKEIRKWPSTFFAAGTIPPRFCSLRQENAEGKMSYVPTAKDVFRYVESVDEDQLPLLPARSCMSIYNLCE